MGNDDKKISPTEVRGLLFESIFDMPEKATRELLSHLLHMPMVWQIAHLD